MRTIILGVFALFLGLNCQATSPQTDAKKIALDDKSIWLDAKFQRTKKKKDAVYAAVLMKEGVAGYFFKVNFLTGQLKMEGYYADAEMTIPNGVFTFYHKNGKVESVGEYADGTKFGIWQRFDSTGYAMTNKIYTSQQMMDAITNSDME